MSKNAVMPLDDYVSACDTIREKTDTTDLIKSGEMADKINSVFEKGKQEEYDSFWDAFQDNGNRNAYEYAFYSKGWTDKTFKPKYDIIFGEGNYTNTLTFGNSQITNIKKSLDDCGVNLDLSQTARLNGTFQQAKTEYLPPIDLSNCKSLLMGFYSMPNLKSLEIRNLREDCVFDRAMTFCYALENLSITGTIGTGAGGNSSINLQHSPLTKESLLNVIDCLKDFREIIVAEKAVKSSEELLPSYTLVDGEKYTLTMVSDDGGTETTSGTVGDVYILPLGETKTGVEFSFSPIYEGEVALAWIYQEGESLMFHMYFGRQNPKITLLKSPTGTHSIVLGSTKLAKLTDAEKAVATQKGWTLS